MPDTDRGENTMNRILRNSLVLLLTMGVTGITQAGVSTQEAAKLGKELTPVGAQRAGNKDGTIPEWTGKASFAPAMLTITRDQLESLRKRLVKDIGAIVTTPEIGRAACRERGCQYGSN